LPAAILSWHFENFDYNGQNFESLDYFTLLSATVARERIRAFERKLDKLAEALDIETVQLFDVSATPEGVLLQLEQSIISNIREQS